MKLTATFAAVTASLLFAGSVQAQQAQQNAPLTYVELGYSTLDLGQGMKPSAFRGIVGYNFHRNLAVEGMAALNASGSSQETEILPGGIVRVELKQRNAYGVFLKPKVDVENIELFARLGWVRQSIRMNVDTPFGSSSDKVSDSGFAWGVGASYNFTPNVYGTLDFMRLSNDNSDRNSAVTVGVGYRF